MLIGRMFTSILKKLTFWNRSRKTEEINQLRDILLINLNNLDHRMTQEITNLAVQACNIQRQIKNLQKEPRCTRDDLLKCDQQAMLYEEGIFQRMEVRHLIRSITPKLKDTNTACDQFLAEEFTKQPPESWIFYLNSLLPDQKTGHQNDYTQVLYVLAILEEDITELVESYNTQSRKKEIQDEKADCSESFIFTRPF